MKIVSLKQLNKFVYFMRNEICLIDCGFLLGFTERDRPSFYNNRNEPLFFLWFNSLGQCERWKMCWDAYKNYNNLKLYNLIEKYDVLCLK